MNLKEGYDPEQSRRGRAINNKLVLSLLIFALIIIASVGLQLSSQTKQTPIQELKSAASYRTQTSEKGEVVVEVVPTKLSSKENSEFIIRLSTHSVDLSYDIKNIASLTDDKSKVYKPISWTGEKGGHHIEGTLVFPKLSQDAMSVTLKIPGIGSQDRIFEWRLD